MSIFDFELITIRGHHITLGHLAWALIILVSRGVLWGLNKLFTRKVDDPTEMASVGIQHVGISSDTGRYSFA